MYIYHDAKCLSHSFDFMPISEIFQLVSAFVRGVVDLVFVKSTCVFQQLHDLVTQLIITREDPEKSSEKARGMHRMTR